MHRQEHIKAYNRRPHKWDHSKIVQPSVQQLKNNSSHHNVNAQKSKAYHSTTRLPSEEVVRFAEGQQQMDVQRDLDTVSALIELTDQEIELPMILEDLPSV
jgi:hypothetical protein